jgi:hypothetical protein
MSLTIVTAANALLRTLSCKTLKHASLLISIQVTSVNILMGLNQNLMFFYANFFQTDDCLLLYCRNFIQLFFPLITDGNKKFSSKLQWQFNATY